MDYNEKISITIVNIVVGNEDENLIIGEYHNFDDELITLKFTVRKRFDIKPKQILIGEFKKFFEVNQPLAIALGVIYNEEVHKTPFPCQLLLAENSGKQMIFFNTEEDLDKLY